MDGKRLTGAGSQHVVVLEVIGYVCEFDLIVHWINDINIFYNNEKSVEYGPSICDSLSKFSNDCNKSIIQRVETKFGKQLFDNNNFSRLCNSYKLTRKSNDDEDDNNSVATVRISDESSSNSEDDDLKQETENSDWETPQGIRNVSTSISQPFVFDFELCDLHRYRKNQINAFL